MKKTALTLKVLASGFLLLLVAACNPIEDNSDSSTLLVVENILGTNAQGTEANYLESDVQKIDVTSGEAYVTSDAATVTFAASLLDPTPEALSSQYNDIFLTKYVVTYTRPDGNNRQGVDVPYSFEGSMSSLIKVGDSTAVSFIVVRAVSKVEPPLINLIQNRAEGVLQCRAQIDFYGHDMTDHKVKTTCYLAVFFANYIDTAGGGGGGE